VAEVAAEAESGVGAGLVAVGERPGPGPGPGRWGRLRFFAIAGAQMSGTLHMS